MRNVLAFYFISMLLAGCSILPGMENIDPSSVPMEKPGRTIYSNPVIKPITVSSLADLADEPYVYRVAPQDILNITVWNYAEFNPPALQNAQNTNGQSAGSPGYLVDHRGNIYFPLIGNVQVQGKSIDEIRSLLTRKLSYYLRKPNIIARVADFRSQKIYVMGEVLKPGFFPINDQPLSITDAITMAGSLDPNASDPRHIYVIRGSLARPSIYWLNVSSPAALLLGEKFQLKDHDVVIVSTAAVTRWNRFLNQMLPSLQTIWYTRAITKQ